MKSIEIVVWGICCDLPIEFSSSIAASSIAGAEQSVRRFVDNASVLTENARREVESYVQKKASEIGLSELDSLVDCVKPQMLLVRIDDDGSGDIALLCGFKYDPEHDIAIVFSGQEFVNVGSQDLVVWW